MLSPVVRRWCSLLFIVRRRRSLLVVWRSVLSIDCLGIVVCIVFVFVWRCPMLLLNGVVAIGVAGLCCLFVVVVCCVMICVVCVAVVC